MIKKIIVTGLLVGFSGVLIWGGVNRTLAKSTEWNWVKANPVVRKMGTLGYRKAKVGEPYSVQVEMAARGVRGEAEGRAGKFWMKKRSRLFIWHWRTNSMP